MVYLRENGINCEIHLSGECGEINSQMVASLGKLGLKRVIFSQEKYIRRYESGCLLNVEKRMGQKESRN